MIPSLGLRRAARDCAEWVCVKLAKPDLPACTITQRHEGFGDASYVLNSPAGDPVGCLHIQVNKDPFALFVGPPIYGGAFQELLVVYKHGEKISGIAFFDERTQQHDEEVTPSNGLLRIWEMADVAMGDLIRPDGTPDSMAARRTLCKVASAYLRTLQAETLLAALRL
ncbi:MAG: hypothetical protein M3N08_07560 [Pseudomonadota bacterium]|nr:hypothetical protein [Pseudomonadota bacterium]